ncbi:MAG: nirA [Fusobacteria bacterium]|nr:MAG: nirA [Fusobacteriota bacterium]KAF0230184.1 MAG: hypothetical protein FD182_574 [Fusobacteriota bacterium]
MLYNKELYNKFIKDYCQVLEEYKFDKSVNFKKASAFLGIYEEKSGSTYMIRPRIGAGVVSINELKKLSDLAEKYAQGRLHFTTRQCIQLHRIELENTIKVIEGLIDIGLTTLGAGGNAARNVSCSPLSGVARDEIFDVTSFAELVNEELVKNEDYLFLPRKYKISFSNSSKDTGNATFADLGFIAVKKNKSLGFKVYAGGGLGPSPRIALKIEDFIEPEDIMYYVRGMKIFFEKEGDRENRARARIRHIITRLGEEEFIKRYRQTVDELKKSEDLKINIKINPESRSKGKTDKKEQIHFQKEKGKCSLFIHPPKGIIETGDVRKILNFLESLPYQLDMRLSSNQGIFIRNLDEKDAGILRRMVRYINGEYPVFNSIACIGSKYCKPGVVNSQDLLESILEHFKKVEKAVKENAPKVYISGCPSSCGQHYISPIGFLGKQKKINDVKKTYFRIFLGGRLSEDSSQIGKEYGEMEYTGISYFLERLTLLKIESGIKDINEFIDTYSSQLENMIVEENHVE